MIVRCYYSLNFVRKEISADGKSQVDKDHKAKGESKASD